MPVSRVAATVASGKKGSSINKGKGKGKDSKDSKEAKPFVPYDKRPFIGCCGNRRLNHLAYFCADIRDATWFQTTLIGVIVLAGILVGIQTYEIPDGAFADTLEIMDQIILQIFILEIVVKMIAEGKNPLHFFTDAWNVFDFLIVAVGLMPFGGNAVTALRLVRLLRVLKLVRALPKLRILVLGLLLSMSSIAYIGMLLMLLFYLYAVLGVSIFGFNDVVHFGSLHIAFITLFRCATLEDWTDVMYINMIGCDNYGYDGMQDLCVEPSRQQLPSVIYFCSFVTLSSMMILNLFIGVITSSMAEAKTNLSAEATDAEPDPDFSQIHSRMEALETEISTITQEMREVIAEKAALMPSEVGVSLATDVDTKSMPEGLDGLTRPSPVATGAGGSRRALISGGDSASRSSPTDGERLFTRSKRGMMLDADAGGDSKGSPGTGAPTPMRRIGSASSRRSRQSLRRVTPESSLVARGALGAGGSTGGSPPLSPALAAAVGARGAPSILAVTEEDMLVTTLDDEGAD